MNAVEKKVAGTIGALMLENYKLTTMLEAANAEIERFKAVVAESAKNHSANGDDGELTASG